MKEYTVLWTQSLENDGADYISYYGAMLDEDDTEKRGRAVSLISNTTGNPSKTLSENGTNLVYSQKNYSYVLEIFSEERDCFGRISPINCYWRINDLSSNELCETVMSDVEKFALKVRRTLPASFRSDVKNLFESMRIKDNKQKNASRSLKSIMQIVITIGLFIAVFIKWLTNR